MRFKQRLTDKNHCKHVGQRSPLAPEKSVYSGKVYIECELWPGCESVVVLQQGEPMQWGAGGEIRHTN